MGLITDSLQFSGNTYASVVITKISTGSTTLDSDPNSLATNQVVKNYIDYGGGDTGGTASISTALSSEISTRSGSDTSLSTQVSNEISRSTSLSTIISSEVSTRAGADTSLSTAILQPWIDTNRCGFVDNSQTSISFNSSTYVFTLSGLTSWSYYRAGVKNIIEGNKTVTLPNPPSTGIYYITINSTDGTLISGTTLWTLLDSTIPVASILWNSGNTPKYLMADERHLSDIDRKMHAYLHLTRGTQYISGGVLTGPITNNAQDISTVYGVSPIRIADDNMIETLPGMLRYSGTTNDYLVLFRSGATTWTWEMSPVPFRYIGAGYIQYDNNGVMTNGINARWYNTYVLFTDYEGVTGSTVIPGRAAFTSLALAQAESPLTFDFTGFPIAESIIAYQLTWNTANGNANKGKVVLAATPKKINITTTSTIGSGAGTDHNTLAGLQGGTTTEYYHLTNADFIVATGISATVSTEISDRISDVHSLSVSISTNTSTDTSTHQSLSTSISSEISSRTSGDGSLSVALSNEIGIRSSADSSISTSLTGYAPLSSPAFTGSIKVSDGNPVFTLQTTSAGSVVSPINRKIIWSDYLDVEAGSINVLDYRFDTLRTDMAFTVKNSSGTLQEALRIQYSGNVGIGTIAPSQKLHVRDGYALFSNNAGNDNVNSGIHIRSGIGTTKYNWLIGAQYNIDNTFEITPSTEVSGTTFSTPALAINYLGHVSIGAGSPLSITHISETELLSSTVGEYISMLTQQANVGNNFYKKEFIYRESTGSDWTTAAWVDGIGIDSSYLVPMNSLRVWWKREPYQSRQSWGVGADTFMTLNSYGNIGIGNIGASDTRLTIKGTTTNSSGYGLVIKNSSDSTLFSVRNDGFFTTNMLMTYAAPYTSMDAILTDGGNNNKCGWTNTALPSGVDYAGYMSFGSAGDRYGGQIVVKYDSPELWFRQVNNGISVGWKKVANTDSPTFTGPAAFDSSKILMQHSGGAYGVGIRSTAAGGGTWVRRYGFFKDSDLALLGGFGGIGEPNTLTSLWIGREYNDVGVEVYLDGSVYLKYDNGTRFSTTSAGVDITGTATASSTMTATNFILSSDERMKTNIVPISNEYIDIDYKQFELKNERNQIRYGVIAQQLQKTHPELVRIDKDGILSVAYIDLFIKEIVYLKNKIAELERRIG